MAVPGFITNNSAIVVPPAATALTNDIRDLKPLADIPNDWAWLWWLLAILIVGAVAWILWRRWKGRLAAPPAAPVLPPHVRAKQRLEGALRFIHDPRVFCFHVSDALRDYLEERFSLRAPERTTEEFLVELQQSPALTISQKDSLRLFLEGCDLVKFARFEPTESALRELYECALRLVDETRFDAPAGVGAPARQDISDQDGPGKSVTGKPEAQTVSEVSQ